MRNEEEKHADPAPPPPVAAPLTFPQQFEVKYLGQKDAGGLWGIRHTRSPVDVLVAEAKERPSHGLPTLLLQISEQGVTVNETQLSSSEKKFLDTFYPIEVISYGVQDLIYTRVFAMIVVEEEGSPNLLSHPFVCHAFVCDSRGTARKLTFALAQAFQHFSARVSGKNNKPKKFAIDLRSAEEKEADLREMDSEA